MIKIKNLTCSYDKNIILQNTDAVIEDDITILGINGSGKSTLAKAICGLLDYKGEILVDATDIKNLTFVQRAKLISYIPAKLDVYDRFITVEEFVLLGRFAHKGGFSTYSQTDKDMAKSMIKLLGIEHLGKHTLNSLSSGEQQLVQIASSLTQQSKIIIFDEPTANLDPKNSKKIAKHIKELKNRYFVILITHDLHLANYIGSEILFLKDKKLQHFKQSDNFFEPKNLSELFGVEFDGMDIKYG